ncbi:hypothetical protein NQ318_009419 [Aromia moschata]|uniref:Uncharacterized protein n=1 Tax=Aromia moschata TaxID=1265417 RepID=A0AAV8Z798_9CUCU|nr:hypothetical protein NQ318_009419 [Aromia moschata]
MAELGNSLVNKIYEANVPDDFTRASEHCVGAIREAWIRAKYVDKQFVKTLPQFDKTSQSPSPNRSSRASLMEVRKWSVRKMRRRPRSCDKRDKKRLSKSVEDVKEKIDKIPESIENNNSCSSGKDEDTNSESSKRNSLKKRTSILLFGNDLDKQPIEGAIDLSSDQESTGGEEDETVGEEDISKLQPDLLLYKAAAAHNLPVMCEALALGADKCWINADDRGRSPIHAAVLSGSVMPCAYLILNGAKINAQDQDGKTPLHLATQEGHTAQHRADQHLEDDEGKVPLSMAEQKEHADIVTLLRLGRLNEEMKDSELGVTGDDTFNDVVRDFSRLACSHPERLQRPKNEDE